MSSSQSESSSQIDYYATEPLKPTSEKSHLSLEAAYFLPNVAGFLKAGAKRLPGGAGKMQEYFFRKELLKRGADSTNKQTQTFDCGGCCYNPPGRASATPSSGAVRLARSLRQTQQWGYKNNGVPKQKNRASQTKQRKQLPHTFCLHLHHTPFYNER